MPETELRNDQVGVCHHTLVTSQRDQDPEHLGAQGWELVQVTTGPQGGLIAFFKREVE